MNDITFLLVLIMTVEALIVAIAPFNTPKGGRIDVTLSALIGVSGLAAFILIVAVAASHWSDTPQPLNAFQSAAMMAVLINVTLVAISIWLGAVRTQREHLTIS